MFFELATEADAATDADATLLLWPSAEGSSTVRASVDPWLRALGPVSPAAVDLVRIATAVLIADRRSPRPASWQRDLRVRVHALEPARWVDAMERLAGLLTFLSGDSWEIDLVADGSDQPAREEAAPERAAATRVALFSGGLDSFCGAVVGEAGGHETIYVSQRDNPTVAASQNRTSAWLRKQVADDLQPREIYLAQGEEIREGSSRTRSLLFLALGIAAADGAGIETLIVPENGFTSINPPLRIDRTGALSTRSTHPYSLALLDLIRESVGINVDVENPFAWLTKGEVVADAARAANTDIAAGVAETLSCSKLDGRLYKGGNQNWNCGLCVACILRRAAIAAADLDDETPYVATRVKGSELTKLIERRRPDIQAVKWALAAGPDEDLLIADADFPPDFDLDGALDLWARTLEELDVVDLP